MRKDMHKVLVEEPRHGGGPSKKYRRANLPDELLPKFEGIKRPHTDRKRFGEHLGPLKRWLRSNVGRPWNDVYSEAAEVMRGGNPVRTHIRFHMMDMIERHTFMRDGEVWCYTGAWYARDREMRVTDLSFNSHWPKFYVHPISGLFLAVQGKRHRPKPRFDETRLRWISSLNLYRKLKGIWFECLLRPFPDRCVKGDSPWRYDFAEGRMLCRAHALDIYRDHLFCVQKRQLSSKELKSLALRNDTFSTDSAEFASLL